MMRKGRVKSPDGRDPVGQWRLAGSLLGELRSRGALHDLPALKSIFATESHRAIRFQA
jgi:hypothetical protein